MSSSSSPESRRAERQKRMYTIPISEEELASISGNAPRNLKQVAIRWYKLLGLPNVPTFGYVARERIRITEVSLEPSVDDLEKVSTKMVAELDVSPDMCNAQGMLDQGCMTSILDEGSAIALLVKKVMEGEQEQIGVSQTFNMTFYQPVPAAGAKLRVVSRSVSTEKGSGCCISEIWDVARHRIVVTGTQIQMSPSR